MKNYNIYLLILFLVAGLSCRKKEYPKSEVIEESQYYSKFDVNGTTHELRAGQDGYYMHSSVEKDSNNVTNYVARLSKADCANCPLGLRIQINDFHVSPDINSSKVDSALAARKYEYLTKSKGPTFQVNFNSQYKGTANSSDYQWSFGDGQTGTGVNPSHTYAEAGKYQVCLTVKGVNQCVSSICNEQNLTVNGLRTAINATATSGNQVLFYPTTSGGKTPYHFLWTLGDGSTVESESVMHSYSISGSYPVTLLVTDDLGVTTTAHYNVVTKSDLSSCASNFSIASLNTTSIVQQSLSKVNISFIDEKGVTFQSRDVTQPASSSFEIISVQNGETNEKGQPTKKLSVRFNCKLSNGSQLVSIDNAEAIICVAY